MNAFVQILKLCLSSSLILHLSFFFPAQSLPQGSPSGKTKGDNQKRKCNAFFEWSRIERNQLPKTPAILDAALTEGRKLPQTSHEKLELNKWTESRVPFAKLVEEGCACSEYSDPFDRSGMVDLNAMSNSNLLLWNVEKFRQLKVKQYLEQRQFARVTSEIKSLFDIARPGKGGKRVVVSYLVLTAGIRRGMTAVRECLYSVDCPKSLLTELPSLMNGFEDRSVVARTIVTEFDNFLVPSLKNGEVADLIEEVAMGGNLTAGSSAASEKLLTILKKHSKTFDLRDTIILGRRLSAEASKNSLRAFNERTDLELTNLKEELAPLTQFIGKSSSKADKGNLRALSDQLSDVHNLVGKTILLNTFSGPIGRVAEIQDRLILQIEGTRLLIGLNLYERVNHSLPSSLDIAIAKTLAPGLQRENLQGYRLAYSRNARTLQFVPVANDLHRINSAKKDLFWRIPKPNLN